MGEGSPQTWIPDESLAGGQIGDLVRTVSIFYVVDVQWQCDGLTKRGGPSGSPILITVLSCLEMAEPVVIVS